MASSVGETQIVAVPGFGGPAPSPGRWWPMDGAHEAWLRVLANLPPRAASDGDGSIVFFTGTGIVSATVASFAFAAAAEQVAQRDLPLPCCSPLFLPPPFLYALTVDLPSPKLALTGTTTIAAGEVRRRGGRRGGR
ncbi:Os01g0717200 [Oryza sativa Japonica Group]|uniref:Os01g0717200 protein n=1 Tax=Oryza sativa subsp. japonica TaxID=39947 RepID=A0A0N7KDM6_ORYSJ|nr:Os01g0717200 [Oryza sativa Japonica Group]